MKSKVKCTVLVFACKSIHTKSCKQHASKACMYSEKIETMNSLASYLYVHGLLHTRKQKSKFKQI